jgi:hypothetical protein
MTQTFTLTQNDVVRYLYGETSDEENTLIEEAMIYDRELMDFYFDCINLKADMDNLMMTPSDASVNRILDYSRNYQPAA